MSCGGGCGGAPSRTNRRGEKVTERKYFDPTAALWAAASQKWMVLPNAGSTSGRVFQTKAAADDYASKTNGIVRNA